MNNFRSYISIAVLIISLFPIMVMNVDGRSGGPDNFSYVFKDSNESGGPVYNWIEISSGNSKATKILADDDNNISGPVQINFSFDFYGIKYNYINISSNGVAGFNTGIGESNNQPVGGSSSHNFIAPFWDDLTTENNCNAGEVYYKTIGAQPNRSFIIEWHDVKAKYGNTCTNSKATFEAILNESGEIKFQYKDVNFGNVNFNNGASATVGIESSTGQGLQYSYNQTNLINGLAISFYLIDTPPIISIISPKNSLYNATDISLNVSANEAISIWNYSLNGRGNITFDPTNTTINASQGANNITVYASDMAGNWNSSVVDFLIDTTPPSSITDLINISYASDYITWIWTDPTNDDFSHVMIYFNGEFKTNVPSGVKSYSATGLIPDTEYTIRTHTVDKSGNINQTWANNTARTSPPPPPPIPCDSSCSWTVNYIIY